MTGNKEKILPFIAMIVLIIGMSATLYVHAQQSTIQNDTEMIIINESTYTLSELFASISSETIETDDGAKTGIPTDEIINHCAIDCPSCHTYTFISSDGYQQTVTWEHMQQGVLSEEIRVFFPDVAHAFWVRDIIEIEVD